MFCIKCGSMIPDGSKFCENCGEPQMTASVDKNLESAYNDIAASQNNQVVPELELPEKTQFEMPKELTTAEAQVGEPVVTTDIPKEDTTAETPVLTTEPEVQQAQPAQQEAATYAEPLQPQATQTQAQAQTQWQQPQTQQNQQFNNQWQQSGNQSNYQNANPNNTSYQPAYGYQPPKKKKTGLIIGIVVAALLIVAAVGLILGGGLSIGSNKGYSNPDKAIQAYFQAVEKGDEDNILAMMPKGWADAVCTTEGYSSNHEFLYNYDYSVFMGYMGKEIESYYVDDEYTETFSSADVESVNVYYSPKDDFDGIEVYYADCTFEDGDWDTFGIYVAEINNKYYIINVF